MIAWTFRVTPKKHPARRAATWTAVLLITESILGAILVLRHLVEKNTSIERIAVQSVHFTNTMILLAAATLTAVFLRQHSEKVPDQSSLRFISLATLATTLFVGATGAIAALADTIFPSSSLHDALVADFASASPALVHIRWLHPACTAFLVASCLVLIQQNRRLGRHSASFALTCTLTLQVVVGIADVLLLTPTWIQVIHLLAADLFWICLVTIAAPALFTTSPDRRILASV
jgi:cytochrome c oxidase assembly protein subunit 15